MHYHDLDSKEALVHLLCAAYMTGIYEEALEEVAATYQEDVIEEALEAFEELKSGLTII